MIVDDRRRRGLCSQPTSLQNQPCTGDEPMPEKKSLHLRATLACAVLLCLSLATSAQQQQATPQTTSPTPTPENPEDATTDTKTFQRRAWRSTAPAHTARRSA